MCIHDPKWGGGQSWKLVKIVTGESYQPDEQQRSALKAARLLMVSGECRRPPWPKTLLGLRQLCGSNKAAVNLAMASGQPAGVVDKRPFDEDVTPKAVKGSAVLEAASAGDGEGVKAALEAAHVEAGEGGDGARGRRDSTDGIASL
jgi:hypothetical protein